MPEEERPGETPGFLLKAEESLVMGSDTLGQLASKVDAFQKAEAEVARIEGELETAKREYNALSGVEIPQLLLKYRLSRIRLSNGKEVTVKEDVNVSIKDQDKFHRWLVNRREDDIVKLTIDFERMEPDARELLLSWLEDAKYEYEAEYKVHPSTLRKYFREMLGLSFEQEERAAKIKEGLCLSPQDPRLTAFAKTFTYHKTTVK